MKKSPTSPTSAVLAALAASASISAAYDSVVVINEIHYNAPAGQSEWIELRNNQGVDVNLVGWKLTGGVDFTFPTSGPGSFIPGGGYLVIAATPALVPGSIGPFTGILDNGGETLRLRNQNDRIMDEVNYDDEGEWPVGADGSGATLSRREAGAHSGPGAWAASTQLGGTPGAENFTVPAAIQRVHVTWGDTWKYADADTAPAADWNQPAYDDSAWSSGAAPLGAQPPATPLAVTANLVVRFRASDITGVSSGGVVTTWTDTANGPAFGDSVAQNATGANSPTWQPNVLNGKAVVRFPATGTGEMRTNTSPGIGGTSGWAIFMVARASTALTNGAVTDGAGDYLLDRNITGFSGNPLTSIKAVTGRWGLQKRNDAGGGLGGPVSTSSISTSEFQIIAIRRNRSLSRFEIWVNGVMEGSATDDGTALTPSPFVLAHHATAGSTQGFKGDIAEFLAYKAELTDMDFQRVGAYLETEYGLNTAFAGVSTPLSPSAPTAYLRKTFTFPGNPADTLLRLSHSIGDGAVFYLNGSELARVNMPAGPVTHTTAASSPIAAPATVGPVAVPASALAAGTNVLAVSLHKAAGSTGTLFSAQLDSVETPPPPSSGGLRFSEITGAAAPAFFVELTNASSSPLSTAGWSIAASTGQTVALPVQTLAPGAFMTLNAAALGFTPADGVRLYLVNGTALGDAREVTSRLRGLTPDGRWGHPSTPTQGAANVAVLNTDVVINEIFYHGTGTSAEQWIELHNKGAAPVDISGWKFTDGIGYQFPAAPPTVIAPGGYIIIAWNPAAFSALHPSVPGASVFGPWTGSLSRRGELITLRDAADNVADHVRYADGGRWSQWADGGGSSLELKNPHADNNVAESWDSSDESLATPWENISYSGLGNGATTSSGYTYYNEFLLGLLDAGEVLVDDIVVQEVTSGSVVRPQLIQNGNFTSGTADKWRNIGNHQLTSIVDDPFSPGNKVMKITATGATEHMHNNCGTTLKDGATYVTTSATSTYTISFRAKWLRGTNRLHSRLYFNRLPKQTLLALPATGGTPGAQNSRYVSNAAPSFSGLSVVPAVPLVGQPATVSIAAADSDGITSVSLFTSINGGAFSSAPMSLSNGRYSAVVPGQPLGTSVQFYVRAVDSLAAASTFPAAGPASRAMIPWEDGRSQLVMPSGARPHNLRIVMTAADANDMYLAENVMSNFYRPCTFIVNDSLAYYDVGTRLKSSEHGRFQEHRAGFNIKFGSDNPFLGAHETISIDKSGNRSNEGMDGTGVTSQREILLKAVMNAAGGIYSQEDDLVRMIPTIAAGTPAPRFTGVGGLGEAILSKSRFDDEYLDGQWDNGGSGALFKQEYIYPLTAVIDPVTRVQTAITSSGNLTAVAENPKISQTGGSPGPAGIAVQAFTPAATGNPAFTIDPKENYRWHWLIRNARATDDFSGLIAAITAVGQTANTPAFKSQTEAALDVDTWLRAAALPMMWMVTDNYLGNGATHNAILYFPPGRKGVLIPWDCDFLNQTTANATSWSMTAGGSISKFIADGANKRRYWCHVLDILNRSFNDAFLTRWATHYSRFGPDDMTTSLPVLRLRATYLRDIIMGTNVSGANAALTMQVPATPFAITTPGPLTSAAPFTTINGNGWLDVDTIRLQGSTAPLAVTWLTQNTWTLQLPVAAGTATYVLEAVTKAGAVTGTASIQVTGSGGVFPAGPGNLIVTEIHYNPPGPGDATEFIELLNITNATLSLTGCHFDDNGQGIAYTFPAGTTIAPGARVVVARDLAAFSAAYPGVSALGPFTGALDNGGEEIVLFAASGLEIFRFTYNDNIGSTDGNGRSLVRVVGCTPNATDYTWRASTANGGNPGTTDAVMFTGDPLADADGDGHAAIVEYAFGTSDTVWNPPTDYQSPNGTDTPSKATPLPNADCAISTHESSDDLVNWTPAATASPSRRFWRWRVALR